MADILVKHNQAATDLQSWANLKARHLGFSEESKGFWFKLDDGSEGGLPVLVPTTIGQGMGRRYTQTAHGFATKQLVRRGGASWVLALATADVSTFATHMVVRVVDASTFDVARVGAWTLGGSPSGDLYLSGVVPGAAVTVKPASPLLVQRVAIGDGLAYHLTLEPPASETASLGLVAAKEGEEPAYLGERIHTLDPIKAETAVGFDGVRLSVDPAKPIDVSAVKTGGVTRIEEDGDGAFKNVTAVSFSENGQLLSAKYSPVLSGNVTSHYHSADRDWDNLTGNPFAGLTPSNMPTVTREAIMQPLPLSNRAPAEVNVVDANMKAYGYSGAGGAIEELFYDIDLQHDYIAGSDVVFHVHWANAVAGGGNVKWQLYYQWVETGAAVQAAQLLTAITASNAAAMTSTVSAFTIPGAGHTYQSQLLFRLFRDSSDAQDTYAGTAIMLSRGTHYPANPGQP